MERIKIQTKEKIIFENTDEVSSEAKIMPQDIMDIPGTAHEKLLALSEMI